MGNAVYIYNFGWNANILSLSFLRLNANDHLWLAILVATKQFCECFSPFVCRDWWYSIPTSTVQKHWTCVTISMTQLFLLSLSYYISLLTLLRLIQYIYIVCKGQPCAGNNTHFWFSTVNSSSRNNRILSGKWYPRWDANPRPTLTRIYKCIYTYTTNIPNWNDTYCCCKRHKPTVVCVVLNDLRAATYAVTYIHTSNGSWRQGIKGEMTCTVYVALVWNFIYWIMMTIMKMIMIKRAQTPSQSLYKDRCI